MVKKSSDNSTFDSTQKPTNPKDIIGSDKIPLHLWPGTATIYGTLGLLEGMLKYGRANWRKTGVRASIYYDAARRHLDAWFEGAENAPDSGVHHLAHVLACIAIIVDAKEAGKLVDDRMYPAKYQETVKRLTHEVKRLKELHKKRNPHHFTIQDADLKKKGKG